MACPILTFSPTDNSLTLSNFPPNYSMLSVYYQKDNTSNPCEYTCVHLTSFDGNSAIYELPDLPKGRYKGKATILIGNGPKILEATDDIIIP